MHENTLNVDKIIIVSNRFQEFVINIMLAVGRVDKVDTAMFKKGAKTSTRQT